LAKDSSKPKTAFAANRSALAVTRQSGEEDRAGLDAVLLQAMKTRTQFIRITAAGLRESHPHDIVITKASPNYWSS
jgi:IMP dehydrogenase/GMP reductase